MSQMIENPKTIADVKANCDEAERIKTDQTLHDAKVAKYRAQGLSDGQAEFAASLVMPGGEVSKSVEQTDQALHDAKVAKYKAAGLSDGEADFAAREVLPGG
jgi:hypothetical protein